MTQATTDLAATARTFSRDLDAGAPAAYARLTEDAVFGPRLRRRADQRVPRLRRHQPAGLTGTGMGRVENKIALIMGATRGQGRAHAVRLAEEGADIIALDICEPIATADHTFGTEEDLAETAAQVEKLDRRIVTRKVDVRDHDGLAAAVSAGVDELGGLDIVCANAGIDQPGARPDAAEVAGLHRRHPHRDVRHRACGHPAIVAAGKGGSVLFTSSAMGLGAVPNLGHYTAAKHGIIRADEDPRTGAGAAVHPGQRRLPDERRHRHDPEPRDHEAVHAPPRQPHAGGRRAAGTGPFRADPGRGSRP